MLTMMIMKFFQIEPNNINYINLEDNEVNFVITSTDFENLLEDAIREFPSLLDKLLSKIYKEIYSYIISYLKKSIKRDSVPGDNKKYKG